MSNQDLIKEEINTTIKQLEKLGLTKDSHLAETEVNFGLGDAVESVLKSVGITEDRFKEWFSLEECNCSKRKKWLNGLFSWKVKNEDN